MLTRSLAFVTFAVALTTFGCSAETDDAGSTETSLTENAPMPCTKAPCAERPVIFVHGHNGHAGEGDTLLNAFKKDGERFDSSRKIGTNDHENWAARSIPRREWLFAFDYYVANGNDAPKSYTAGPGRVGSWGNLRPDNDSYDRGVTHDFSSDLAEAVDDILRATGADQVDIVAHSMGGLITRSYLTFAPNAKKKVGNVLLLATPHKGVPGAVGESWFSDDPIWMDDHELTELDRFSWTARSAFTRSGSSDRDVWTSALMKSELAQANDGPVKHCMKGSKDKFIFDGSANYERCTGYREVKGVDHGGILHAPEASDFARDVLGGTMH